MKIIFFGSSDFVYPILKKLQEKFEVVKIISSPEQLNKKAIKQIKPLNPDLFVVASFGKILSGELLKIPKLGSINIHPSLLPKYRGPSPIQTAILNGEIKTGVSFIKMDEKVDHGPIIKQFEEPILPGDTFATLSKRLFEKAAENLESVINRFTKGQTDKPQDDSKTTFTKILKRADGYIDVEKPPNKQKLERMIRAFTPWPGAWTRYCLNPQTSQKNLIKLLPNQKIQVEGRRQMSYKDFIMPCGHWVKP